MKVTFRTPRDRPPVFRIGDEWFVNLAFGFSEAVDVEGSELLDFLASAPRGSIVLARRLTGREVAQLLHARLSSDHETAAALLPDGARRWRSRRPGKKE